jgi:hypothetical protein
MMPQVRDPGIVGEAVSDAAAAHARDMEDADVEVPNQDCRTRSKKISKRARKGLRNTSGILSTQELEEYAAIDGEFQPSGILSIEELQDMANEDLSLHDSDDSDSEPEHSSPVFSPDVILNEDSVQDDFEPQVSTHLPDSAGYTTRSGRKVKRKIYSADRSIYCDGYHKGLHIFFAKLEQHEVGGKIYMSKLDRAINETPKAAIKSIVKELINVYGGGIHMSVVREKNLTMKQRKAIIRSMMFLKNKFLLSGELEKVKARLVALGNFQDRNLFGENELNSPTVNLLSLFSMAAQAHREGRSVRTVDIGGAYLHAPIGDQEVFLKVDKLLTSILAKIDPSIKPFIDQKVDLPLSGTCG